MLGFGFLYSAQIQEQESVTMHSCTVSASGGRHQQCVNRPVLRCSILRHIPQGQLKCLLPHGPSSSLLMVSEAEKDGPSFGDPTIHMQIRLAFQDPGFILAQPQTFGTWTSRWAKSLFPSLAHSLKQCMLLFKKKKKSSCHQPPFSMGSESIHPNNYRFKIS